ncbi:MAG: 5-formyltetrahydrofolate cyclo-ligase [Phycisphaerales bacterium]
MDPLEQDKRVMRERVREAVGDMTPERRSAWAARTLEWLLDDPIGRASGPVVGFLPDATEPDVEPVLRALALAGRTVAVPRVGWETRAMVARVIPDWDNLDAWTETRRHGVREPIESCEPLDLTEAQLLIVPGVAFDRFGGRLGRGGGFYDRFLARAPEGAAIVGACFAAQVVGRVPTGGHDRPVSVLATEDGRVACAGTGDTP